MDIIVITPDRLEIVIKNAISKALIIKRSAEKLPDRCTLKKHWRLLVFQNRI